MAGLTPTQRTLRALRDQGRVCDIVERWLVNPRVPGGGFRRDLFGFIDIIVLDPQQGIVGVQSCGSAFSAHLKKITDSPVTENAVEWLRAGGRIELWGWTRRKLKRGGAAMRWMPRVMVITLDEMGGAENGNQRGAATSGAETRNTNLTRPAATSSPDSDFILERRMKGETR